MAVALMYSEVAGEALARAPAAFRSRKPARRMLARMNAARRRNIRSFWPLEQRLLLIHRVIPDAPQRLKPSKLEPLLSIVTCID